MLLSEGSYRIIFSVRVYSWLLLSRGRPWRHTHTHTQTSQLKKCEVYKRDRKRGGVPTVVVLLLLYLWWRPLLRLSFSYTRYYCTLWRILALLRYGATWGISLFIMLCCIQIKTLEVLWHTLGFDDTTMHHPTEYRTKTMNALLLSMYVCLYVCLSMCRPWLSRW